MSATQVRHFLSSPLQPIFSKASLSRFQAARSVQRVNRVCDEDRDQSRSRDNRGNEGSGRWRGFGCGTNLYDAILLSSADLMQKQRERDDRRPDGRRGSVQHGKDEQSHCSGTTIRNVMYAISVKGEQHGYGEYYRGGIGGRGCGITRKLGIPSSSLRGAAGPVAKESEDDRLNPEQSDRSNGCFRDENLKSVRPVWGSQTDICTQCSSRQSDGGHKE